MELDPQNALLTLDAGLAQLSTLIVSYSFSAVGAVILLVVGYMIAGVAERSIFAGLKRIRGFDLTLCQFFSKMARYAILRTVDGVYILAPNSTLWSQPVFNYSRTGVRRNDITIGIGYNDDIALAQKILLDLATADGRVNKEPAPTAFVAALADSAVSVTLRYWTSASDFLAAKFDLTRQAKEAFDANGISIPFPQQEVIYREMPTARQ